LETAKRLAAEADDFDSSNGGRLAAMIAQTDGRLDEAIAVLESDPDPDSRALKAAIQIQAGRVDHAIHTLEQLPDHPDAHRLRSLIHLGKGEPVQAKAEAEKALALAPSWYWMRRTAATMRYLAGLSPAAVPRQCPDWPEPVNSTLIRQDEESVSARRAAAAEFERLASGDFEHSGDELSCLNCWRIACLADNADTREEATSLARSILEANPGDYRAMFWVLGRDLEVTIDASVAVLAQRFSEKKASVVSQKKSCTSVTAQVRCAACRENATTSRSC
jgi:tetratricopeptide (TPR) repeat protein